MPMTMSARILVSLFLLAAAPLAAQVPAPADVFGFEPGADYELADYAQMVEYFRQLDEASDRVAVERIGTSVGGRPMLLVYVSSEANIARLDELRTISQRLARAEGVDAEEAAELAERGRAIVWIDGGLHATEVAGAQHSPLLAYRVATEESEEMRKIRENVVLLLMPVMNPDGLDIVVSWYERNLGTEFETSEIPWLYQHYVGHDNNRDWFTLFMPESRAVAHQLYRRWYPQIVYNQHQTAPFPARIFVPPFSDPVNPRIPPLVVAGVNLVGDAMHQRFAEEGKSGVVSRISFDMWWNGGMRSTPYYHNQIGILSETALYEYATPHYYDPAELPDDFGSANVAADFPSIFYQDPWEGGWWRLRDAVDYMVTGSMAVLEIGADLKRDWLYNIWLMGSRAIEQGRSGEPFAYVIAPDAQRNPREAVALVNILRRGGVEVERSDVAFEAGGASFPAGSFIVFTAQAFRPYILDLMEKQVYPDMRQYPGGPPDPPYDISGWTLPIQMDVEVERIAMPFGVATSPVDTARVAPGRLLGSAGWGWALSHAPNAAAIAVNRLLAAGIEIGWAGSGFQAGGRTWPEGTILVQNEGPAAARVEAAARELGIDFHGLGDEPDTEIRELSLPRIGLYKSWDANMDEGWTRWVLEQYEFPFDTLHDADVRAVDLANYDAIILPDQDAEDILEGHDEGDVPSEYTGGLGQDGADALRSYVEDGGMLIAFDEASEFAIEQLDLPITNLVDDLESEEFFVPGTLLGIDVDETDPIAYGMPEEAAAVFSRSRAFGFDDGVVDAFAWYDTEAILLSGWALGAEEYLGGEAAAVRAKHGDGDVVLFGFRPQFRAQPRGTFKMLFNALHAATMEPLELTPQAKVAESVSGN
ncbi:MAG: M14 family zinc carboxypeptidase [Longimicrobiales bacterium]